MASKPPAPRTAKAAGNQLWTSTLAGFELDGHELLLLREAVRTVDVCDALEALVAAEGTIVASPQGPKAHPALVELRQQRITFARLLAALRLPVGEEHDREQHRFGARGAYRVAS